MTQTLFREDAYRTETEALVLSSEPRGVALDRTVFYAQGGGQSGDKGALLLEDGTTVPIVNTIYDADRATILHVPAEGAALPRLAMRVIARIDWELRYKRMRAHTALILLVCKARGRLGLGGAVEVARHLSLAWWGIAVAVIPSRRACRIGIGLLLPLIHDDGFNFADVLKDAEAEGGL